MVYILLSILLFSANNLLWKKNLQQASIPFLMSYRAFFTSFGTLLLVLYFYDLDTIINYNLYRITLGSLFGVIGLFCMLISIKKNSLQWFGIYNLLGILITWFYLALFETIDFSKSIIGIALLISGFSYFTVTKNETTRITLKQHLLLLLMTSSFSISSLIHWKNLTTAIPTLVIIWNQEFLVFISALIILLVGKNKIQLEIETRRYFLKVVLMSCIIFGALLFSFLGLKNTNPLISSALFLATPLTTIVFNSFYFKEKMTLKNSVAIAILALGAFILHLTLN